MNFNFTNDNVVDFIFYLAKESNYDIPFTKETLTEEELVVISNTCLNSISNSVLCEYLKLSFKEKSYNITLFLLNNKRLNFFDFTLEQILSVSVLCNIDIANSILKKYFSIDFSWENYLIVDNILKSNNLKLIKFLENTINLNDLNKQHPDKFQKINRILKINNF